MADADRDSAANKLEEQAREAIAQLMGAGYNFEGIAAKIRGKGLPPEFEDALLEGMRPAIEAAHAARAARDEGDARSRRELAALHAAGERRRRLRMLAGIVLGLMVMVGGVVLWMTSVEGGGVVVILGGLISGGLATAVRAARRGDS